MNLAPDPESGLRNTQSEVHGDYSNFNSGLASAYMPPVNSGPLAHTCVDHADFAVSSIPMIRAIESDANDTETIHASVVL